MALFVTTDFELQRIAPPALPLASSTYSPEYQDQLNKVLRLYFNRLNSVVGQLNSTEGVIPATTVYTVATLPSAATSGSGARAFVSNALSPTFGATVVGGGAVSVPVYSDGTNWKVG
jgi:hypothetical protein